MTALRAAIAILSLATSGCELVVYGGAALIRNARETARAERRIEERRAADERAATVATERYAYALPLHWQRLPIAGRLIHVDKGSHHIVELDRERTTMREEDWITARYPNAIARSRMLVGDRIMHFVTFDDGSYITTAVVARSVETLYELSCRYDDRSKPITDRVCADVLIGFRVR